jgi:hypothetical protein
MGELVGIVAGTVLWTELWVWIARKLGVRPRTAVIVGGVATVLCVLIATSISDYFVGRVLYLALVPAWTGYRFLAVGRAERRVEAARLVEKEAKRLRAVRAAEAARTEAARRPKRKVQVSGEGDRRREPPTARGASAGAANASSVPIAALPSSAVSASDTKCPACGTANEADANYCDSCGRDLRRSVCLKCNTPNRPTALHCKQCGTALPPHRVSPGDATP